MIETITEQTELGRKSDLRTDDAIAVGFNTVLVGASLVPVTLPALVPVVTGEPCQVLTQGPNRYILGPINNKTPRGVVAYAKSAGSQLGITGTEVDLTGLSVTFNAVSTRIYRISYIVELAGTATGDFPHVYITDAANTHQARWVGVTPALVAGAWYVIATGFHYQTGLSGSITRKLRCQRNVGSGNLQTVDPFGGSNQIIVEDIGAT